MLHKQTSINDVKQYIMFQADTAVIQYPHNKQAPEQYFVNNSKVVTKSE